MVWDPPAWHDDLDEAVEAAFGEAFDAAFREWFDAEVAGAV